MKVQPIFLLGFSVLLTLALLISEQAIITSTSRRALLFPLFLSSQQTFESMVMHSGVTPKHNSPPVDMTPHVSIERQQQVLLDLSIHKLHQEQIKYGIEPRLLRFVLINNALRSLQMHVLSQMGGGIGGVREDGVMWLGDQESEQFLNNTFKHGLLSIPASPPTPVKVMKMETGSSPFSSSTTSNSSHLTNGGLLPSLEPQYEQLETMPLETDESDSDSRPVTGCKRSTAARFGADGEESNGPLSKRLKPRSLSLSDSLVNGSSTCTNDLLSEEPTPLSPIDFAKVDVSLYDFDARATLSFPPVAETPRSSPPSSLSCSLHAYTGGPAPNDPTSNNGSSTSSSASESPTHLSLSPESSEPDTLDDIDRIVNLLMA